MAAVKASFNAAFVVNDYGEEEATNDQLPRGTALHAARTPLSKGHVRGAPFSKQHTGNKAAALTIANNSEDTSSASDSEATNSEPSRKLSNGADLTRRAARRVNVWKKSEQERRDEEERARQEKREHEKRRLNHAAHAKQRRRAEIYALNALLRQLQQDKIARFIAAQKEVEEAQLQTSSHMGASLTDMATALPVALVQAVGA